MADTIPDDLATALRDAPDARAIFEKLPPSHQRQYLEWIEDAKRPDTRARRLAKYVKMLRDGQRLHP